MPKTKLLLSAEEKWVLHAVIQTQSINPAVIQKYLTRGHRTYGRQFIMDTIRKIGADQSPLLSSRDTSMPDEMSAITPVIDEVRAAMKTPTEQLEQDRTSFHPATTGSGRRGSRTHRAMMNDVIGLLSSVASGKLSEDEIGDELAMSSERLATIGRKLRDEDSIQMSVADDVSYWMLTSNSGAPR